MTNQNRKAIVAMLLMRAEHSEAIAKLDRALAACVGLELIEAEKELGSKVDPPAEPAPTAAVGERPRRAYSKLPRRQKPAEPRPPIPPRPAVPWVTVTVPAAVERDGDGPVLSVRNILATVQAGPTRPGDLAAAFQRSPKGMRYYIRPLVRDGLITAPGTTQSVRYILTDAGRRYLDTPPVRPPAPRREAIASPVEPVAVVIPSPVQQPVSRTPGQTRDGTSIRCIGPSMNPAGDPCPGRRVIDGAVTRRCPECIREFARRRSAEPKETFETIYSGRKGESLIGDRPGASSLARNT